MTDHRKLLAHLKDNDILSIPEKMNIISHNEMTMTNSKKLFNERSARYLFAVGVHDNGFEFNTEINMNQKELIELLHTIMIAVHQGQKILMLK